MNNLLFCLNATVPVFLVMVAGYIFRRVKIVDESFVKNLNTFNFKVTLPILLIVDIASADFYEVMDIKFVLFCFFVTLGSTLCITVLSFLLLKDKSMLGEFIQASYRGSAAVLGMAFVQNIYGSCAITPLMIIATVPLYNIMAVIILSFTAPDNDKENKIRKIKNSIIEIFRNPIILGIVIGMLLSFLRIPIPFIIDKALHNFSVLATPLALIGLGAGFEGKKAIAHLVPTVLSGLIKLVILPTVFLPAAIMLGFTNEKLVAILIMLGAPTAVNAYIMSKNTCHQGVLSSSCVVFSTFFSSITIALWLFILRTERLI